jgi:hypothetical protein
VRKPLVVHSRKPIRFLSSHPIKAKIQTGLGAVAFDENIVCDKQFQAVAARRLLGLPLDEQAAAIAEHCCESVEEEERRLSFKSLGSLYVTRPNRAGNFLPKNAKGAHHVFLR